MESHVLNNSNTQDKINPESLIEHLKSLSKTNEGISDGDLLSNLLDAIQPVDFLMEANPQANEMYENKKLKKEFDKNEIEKLREKLKVTQKQKLVLVIDNLLKFVNTNNSGLCVNNGCIYVYTGAYWKSIETSKFQLFLGDAATKMGIDKLSAKHFQYIENLFKQFNTSSYLHSPSNNSNKLSINLLNGTFDIEPNAIHLRSFNPEDFLIYQLPFQFYQSATAPLFHQFLNKVLPDKESQLVLSEYLGYVFLKNGTLKLEKTLLLYGTGANGKSVIFEIIKALVGNDNFCSYSLQNLTDDKGYYRAQIGNKLLNYSSELSGNLKAHILKLLVSGEPVDARLPYLNPFIMTQYAKLIFNCNELPKDIEHSHAYFRRFIILPFKVTIPPEEQDKELSQKIIKNELSGIFNWVLEGLQRLLKQKHFTECQESINSCNEYEKQSDSIRLFLEENNYKSDLKKQVLIKDIYPLYKSFCIEDGYRSVSKSNFIKRLQNMKIAVDRIGVGMIARISNDTF